MQNNYVRKLNNSEWLEKVNKISSATFYHTPYWYEVWKNYNGLEYSCFEIELSQTKKLLFPCQIKSRLKGLQKEYISGPVGTYGGFIYDSQEKAINEESFNKINPFNFFQIATNPFCSQESLHNSIKKTTQVIDLNVVNFSTENWSKTAIRNRKKALKLNYKLIKAQCTEEWNSYFKLYEESIKRWGDNASNKYNYNLFKNIQKLDSNYADLYYLNISNKMACGGIYFKYHGRVHCWHSSLGQEYLKSGVFYLFKSMMIDLYRQHFKALDLGSSGGHVGVEKLKQRIGCKAKTYYFVQRRPIIFNLFKR